ncbi:hypothetical protein ACQ86O_06770 [Serratia sp. L9]|uniref:hypothetical protein n=1 Tax=Serratia sp. L9 TaxID=3423946 RepID=UPI003D679B58
MGRSRPIVTFCGDTTVEGCIVVQFHACATPANIHSDSNVNSLYIIDTGNKNCHQR